MNNLFMLIPGVLINHHLMIEGQVWRVIRIDSRSVDLVKQNIEGDVIAKLSLQFGQMLSRTRVENSTIEKAVEYISENI